MDNTIGSKEKMEIFVLELSGDGAEGLNSRTLTEKEKEKVIGDVEEEAKSSGDK